MPTMSELVAEYVSLGGTPPTSGRFRTKAEGERKIAELHALLGPVAADAWSAINKAGAVEEFTRWFNRREANREAHASVRGFQRLCAALQRRPRLRDYSGLDKRTRAILRRDIRISKREKYRRRKLRRLLKSTQGKSVRVTVHGSGAVTADLR